MFKKVKSISYSLARIGQVFRYFFVKADKKIDDYALKKLSTQEYQLFKEMGNYDKLHSYNVAVEIEKRKDSFADELWIKAALLHDCGKDKKIGFAERVIFALLNIDGRLKKHPETGYEKLKNINAEVAEIIKVHHDKSQIGLIREFQKIDDMC